MNVMAPAARPEAQTAVEVFDVLVVGAGISGIGAAYHLQQQCPGKSFVVLEAQQGFGGTWRTHRYPGVRSDSDLYTFGYRFKPWTGAPIATADKIQCYLGEVVAENGLDAHVRYGHHITAASWSTADALWTIDALTGGRPVCLTARFLYMCQGYYRHTEPYTSDWPGMSDFKGRIIHPQTWPEDLDYAGKTVVVIGSGATAATLIPAMAGTTRHITMLQRSPTFFRTGRNAIALADELRDLGVDEAWIHEITRRRIMRDSDAFTRQTFEDPAAARQLLLDAARAHLGPDFDIDTHFTPAYRPWRQRIAFLPDGDLFKAIAAGSASVVTDGITRFDATGIQLASGGHLDADIIVTATGFHLSVLGDIAFTVDGVPLDFADTVTLGGMMFTGVPNLAWVFGYLRASWTLRADLVADFVCRLVNHMDARQARTVRVALRPEDEGMELLPWIDPENFNPGYLQRGLHLLPKCGSKPEWAHTQDHWLEKDALPGIDLEDAAFRYS